MNTQPPDWWLEKFHARARVNGLFDGYRTFLSDLGSKVEVERAAWIEYPYFIDDPEEAADAQVPHDLRKV